LFFFRHYHQVNTKTLIALIASSVLATLFRVEGILFAVILPLLALTQYIKVQKKPIRLLIQVALITSIALLAFYFISSNNSITGYSKVTQIESALKTPFDSIQTSVEITTAYINKLSTKGFSENYAPAILAFTFVAILITEIFTATSPLYAIALITYLLRKQDFRSNHLFKPWVFLIVLNLIILQGYLISRFFLAGRYPIALSLILLIPLPFFINSICQQIKEKRVTNLQKKIILTSIILFTFASIDGVVSFGAKKDYLKRAGIWVSSNSDQNNETFYTNNLAVDYYAGSPSGKRIRNEKLDTVIKKLNSGKLASINILAIQVSRKNPEGLPRLVNSLNTNPTKAFENKAGDSVYIFKL
jgi:cell division protein FtsB